jgi:uncharacterized protein (TIGR02246 family)
MTTDEQAIRDLVFTWLSATKAGDHETVLGLMAEDVVFLQAGQEPIRGRTAFAKMQQAMANIDIDTRSAIQEIRVFGDWAYCWNHLTIVVTAHGDDTPVKRSGHVLSVLQKQNGRWLIVRDANLLTVVPD